MKAWKLIKRILTCACVVYTILTVALIVFQFILTGTDTGLYVSRFLWAFVFSVAFGCAEQIRKTSSLSGALRLFLHVSITVAAFFLCLILPAAVSSNIRPSTSFLIIVMLLIVYFLCFGISRIFRTRLKQAKEEDSVEEYVPHYHVNPGKGTKK